jgi:multidrug efflux pump subunit AcrB
MTTAAAMFGATLLLSGFVTKRGLGIAIIGGLVLSQMPTLETTPTLYLKFYELGARVLRRKQLQSWGRVT